MDITLSEIRTMLREWGKGTIIAGDFNAKSPAWNETRTDSRGRKLSEWIASENLIIHNNGNTPTFKRREQESIIDLTLSTDGISEQITAWKVLDDTENGSDHQYIYFETRNNSTTGNVAVNPACNINTLDREILKSIMLNKTSPSQIDEFDEGTLTQLTQEICNRAMRRKGNKGRSAAYWWNDEINDKRKQCI